MPRRNNGPKLRFLEKRGTFYICWTDGGRSRQRSTGTAERREAEIALAEFLHDRYRPAGPRDPAEVYVTDVLADYAEHHAPNVRDPERIVHSIMALTPFWTGKTVTQVTDNSCRAYLASRGRAPGTVRRELGVLRAAMNAALRSRQITYAVPVWLPTTPLSKERWLTRREVAALLRAVRQEPSVRLYLPLFVLIGVYTGARKEAILSLRWTQVDLERGRINFNPPGREQTKKLRPMQPIAPPLLPHLRRARLRGSDLGYVINIEGRRIKDVKTAWAKARARAGLLDVTRHTLRHTAATWLMQKGVSLWQASGFLGMSEATLVKVYGHHCPDYLQDAANAFR